MSKKKGVNIVIKGRVQFWLSEGVQPSSVFQTWTNITFGSRDVLGPFWFWWLSLKSPAELTFSLTCRRPVRPVRETNLEGTRVPQAEPAGVIYYSADTYILET